MVEPMAGAAQLRIPSLWILLFLFSLLPPQPLSAATDFSHCGGCDGGDSGLWSTENILQCQKVSDFLIATAYFSIPLELLYFTTCSDLFPLKWILLQFGAFIVLCGLTHLISVFTYGPHSFHVVLALTVGKFLTALVSVATAITLLKLIPQLLRVKVRENFLRIKARELDQEVGKMKRQEEASWHVRMLTQEIRKSLDRHTILHTTMVELAKMLQLQNCAVWMPNEGRTEMMLTHHLREREITESHRGAIPIGDPDVVEIKATRGAKVLGMESALGFASRCKPQAGAAVAAIRMPMLRVSNVKGDNPEMIETSYAILVLVLPEDGSLGWGEQELEIIEVIADQVAVALSHAAVLEESQLMREKLAQQHRDLLRAKHEAVMASEARNSFQSAMYDGMRRPMHSVLGLVSMMQQASMNPCQRLVTDAIVKTASVASTLMNDVMQTSTMDREHLSLVRRPFSLHSLIKEAVSVVRCLSGSKGIDFEFQVENSLPERVVGDEKRVFHIVLHMVGTLIHQCSAGCLSLYVSSYNETEERHNQDWILQRADLSSGYVCVKFEIRIRKSRDNLLGSSSSQISQGPNANSSEMGLSFNMCKKIVQMMNGNIWSVSDPEGLRETVMLALQFQVQHVTPILQFQGKMEVSDSLWPRAVETDILITPWIDAAMEGPVTASLGPMAPLLRQVHSLSAMAPEHIQGGSDGDVKRLQEHLEVLCRDLLEPEETSSTPKWWRKEVRELLYDTEDRLDEVIIFHAGNFSELIADVEDACERRKRLQVAPSKTTKPDVGEAGLSYFTPQQMSVELSKPISVQGHPTSIGVVGIEDPMNKLVEQLAFDNDKQKRLKVIPIVGFPGAGKTTLAGILYYRFRRKFQCSAFVRVSRTPDMRSLLISILSQIKVQGLCGFPDVHDLIDGIRQHLKGKRYFIIMDDLWTASIWDIVSRAFPDADYGSRIITTTQVDDVALACCRYYPDYIEISPLNDDHSKELFFTRIFGSEDHCPPDFNEVSCKIINKCAGLPLAIVSIASLLASESYLILEKWEHIQDSLPCTRANPTSEGVKGLSSDTAFGSGGRVLARGPKIEEWKHTQDSLPFTSEGLKQVLNLVYNNLPPHLKACLLYVCMYPEGYLVRKHDLVRQWVAEDLVNVMGGRGAEETAGVYFDELVSRGMIQPAVTNHGNEVLSCTVHHMVLDLIRHKSKELDFIITVDNLQSTLALPDEVRRLSVQFGGSKGADVPENILILKVRSLLYWGFFECVPSVVDYALLRVLILHIWADGDETSFDLRSISELLRLRYLKIQCNIMVNLPDEIKGLKCLETLEVDARLCAVPCDIAHLKKLLHLLLPSEAILPKGLDGLKSLLTLGCFDLSKNSTQNVTGLAELTNLQNVHLTCSTEPSGLTAGSMEHLGSILEKLNDLRSLTLHGAGSASQIISDDGLSIVSPSPALLENLELLPRICTLSRLPKWIGELSRLSILKIELLDLSVNDIAILKELASLASLSLSVRTEHAQWIIFDNEGFPALKYFKFVRTQPYMSFLEGAMPNVRMLKLAFDVNRLKPEYSPETFGFQHMTSLTQISVKFGGAGADDSNKRDAERVWKDAFTNHPNNPIFDARWVDCIFNGNKTTDVEDTEGHDSSLACD